MAATYGLNIAQIKRFVTVCLVVCGGISTAVYGEKNRSGETVFEEVIVTAQKKEQRLIDVPISISALSEESLVDMRVQNVDDLARVVPNLVIRQRSPGAQIISIRGVSNNTGTSPLVGIYLDELPLSVSASINIDLQTIDIQRIEVLKGPQGSLYGQGSVGGVVRFISNSPTFDGVSGSLNTSIYNIEGGDSGEDVKAIANFPLIDDKLAFRVAASYRNKGGWIDQIDPSTSLIDNENANDTELTNVRLRGLWNVNDDLVFDLTVVQYRNKSGGQNIINTGDPDDSQYSSPLRNNLPLPSTELVYDYELYNVTFNWDFGFATLTSSSSYFETERDSDSFAATTNSGLDFLTAVLGVGDVISQEIRLTSNSSNALQWVAGAFYSDLKERNVSVTEGYRNGVDQFAAFGGQLITEITGNSESYAVFGDLSYDLFDRLTISLGARYYEDDRSSKTVPNLFLPAGLVGNENFDNISLKGSISYAFTDDVNVYFNVSEGFRSGGFNFETDGSSYEPETVLSYELGAKASLLDGRLVVDGAYYFADYEDYQSPEYDFDTGLTATLNPGEADIEGFEFAMMINVTEQFAIGVNGNVIDAEFSKIAPNVPRDLTATPPIIGFTSPVNRGDPLNFVAEYSYTLSVDYRFNFSSSVQGFAHVNYNRQGPSSIVSRPVVGVVDSTPTNRLNGHIGAQWGSVTAKLFGHNLTNDLRPAFPSVNTSTVQGQPRTFGVDVLYEF